MIGSGRRRGFALLAVLGALTVLSALSAALVLGLRRGAIVEESLVRRGELREASRSGIRAAAALLQADDPKVDSAEDAWAATHPPMRLGDLTLEMTIRDEESTLPLGGVIRPDGLEDPLVVARLERLIRAAKLPDRILPCLLDWIDPDRLGRPGGMDRPSGPRVCRDGLPLTLGELRLLPPLGPPEGPPSEAFLRLRSLVGLRPTGLVNLNTAPPEVLQALSSEVTPSMAAAIVAERRREPFRRPADLRRVRELSPQAAADLLIAGTVASRLFRVRAEARAASCSPVLLTAHLQRREGGIQINRWSIR